MLNYIFDSTIFKTWISPYTIIAVSYITKLFIGYKQYETNALIEYNHLYRANEFIHYTSNYVNYFFRIVNAEIYDYKIQPADESWFNYILYYKDGNKTFPLREKYQTVPFFYKRVDFENFIHVNLHAYKTWQQIDLNNVRSLFLLKCREKYICKLHPKEFSNSNIDVKPVSNPFLEIIYKNLDDDSSHDVDIPKSYFYDNNDILSCTFLKRYFEYKVNAPDFHFSHNYVLIVTNFNMEEETITNSQYVHLGNNEYSIENV